MLPCVAQEFHRCQSRPKPACRAALTLLELLIVIAVTAILVSLLLAAVVRARAAARLVTCQNNSRQLAFAFSNASESIGGFPTGTNYLRRIYSYADAGNLQDAIERGDGSMRDGDFPSPPWLLCPDDEIANPAWGDSNYILSDGVPPSFSNGSSGSPASNTQQGRGVHRFSEKRTPIHAIDDGLSNTILASERLVDPFFYPNIPDARLDDGYVRSHASRYHFWFSPSIPIYDELDPFVNECRLVDSQTSPWYPIDANPFLSRLWHHCSIGFNHVDSPNSNSCYLGDRLTSDPINPTITGSTPATSQHVGCVVASLCDGAVRTVSDSIDVEVWRAIGTISGHESNTTF